jgi:cell division protein ZapA
MSEKLSVKVAIANRLYPLMIDAEEEEAVRKAAKLINEKIKLYEEKYSVKDKQDLLAMCVLEMATQNKESENKNVAQTDDKENVERLREIESFLSNYLNRF